mmetsp:Transcript_7314/g.17871  ORF Transcript_7314/g.17871 Transcript_7314/m.17871 type:complete len:216 (+) Transcript_7314:151-798(+)
MADGRCLPHNARKQQNNTSCRPGFFLQRGYPHLVQLEGRGGGESPYGSRQHLPQRLRILPASPTRVGEAGGIRQGHGHHCLLGHGGFPSSPVAGRVSGHSHDSLVYPQAQAPQARCGFGKANSGLSARRTDVRRYPQIPREPAAELCGTGQIRQGGLRSSCHESKALWPAPRGGLHHQAKDINHYEMVVGGIPPQDFDCGSSTHRQERGTPSGNF